VHYSVYEEVPKLWDATPGALLFLWGGGRLVYMRDIYFERNINARQNVYFVRRFAWLKYFYHSVVPVLAPNYKQYILSPAKVRKSMLFTS
jgi:hypothetical protein